MRIIINCSKPRLSDEEIDPLEMDDLDGGTSNIDNGWLPWDVDDILDIERIIEERMPLKQRQVIDAFLRGMTYSDIEVSEKYWRYHFEKAVEFIKEELQL